MFTGLIQKKGVFKGLRGSADSAVLDIDCEPWADSPVVLGESIATQGVCLTVAAVRKTGFSADVLPETLGRTAFGKLKSGAAVNLERALRLSDRLGGHVVTGHIDGTGTIGSVVATGRDRKIRILCGAELSRYIVMKGSVALDGVSLTVSAATDAFFEVCVIPTTWRETSLSERVAGDIVNIETDIMGRYAERFAAPASSASAGAGLSLEKLSSAGFQI